MIALNDVLLGMDGNSRIWVIVCLSVAAVAILLALLCARSPRVNRTGRFLYMGVIFVLSGAALIYGGVSSICRQRRILKDDVRVTGVVTEVHEYRGTDRDDRGYRGRLVYTDQRGVRHERRMSWSQSDHPLVGLKVPVVYYRGNPDLAIVDPSWMSFVGPWFMLLMGIVLLITSYLPFRHVKRLLAEPEGGQEGSPQDPEVLEAGGAELRFRLAVRMVIADGTASGDEKRQLKMLAKQFKISNQAAKEIVKDEVKTFRESREES